MKKRIISLLLITFMILSVSIIGVSAEVSYDLYIGEIMVTSSNSGDVLGDGTVSFDKDTNTIILNNANIQGTSLNETGTGILANDMNLTIELIGNNTITVENSENVTNYGVLVSGGALAIKNTSDGKLTVNAGDATDSVYGIYSAGPISVSGASLDITTGDADTSIGIKTEAEFFYDADTSKIVTVNRAPLYFTDNAKVVVATGKGVTASQGINCYGDLTVNAAELNVTSGVCENTSDAIVVTGFTKFVSGKVTAFAQGGGTDASAITCCRDENLGETRTYGGSIGVYFGAEVVAKTGEVEKNGAGVTCATINIHGGKLDIAVGNAIGSEELCCYGISTQHGIRIDGGTTSISVPVPTEENHDFTPIKIGFGYVLLSDSITVTGTEEPFESGHRSCVQADPDVPVVFTDRGSDNNSTENKYKDGQLIVEGTAVTNSNAADVLGDGTVSFDKDTNTIILNNANIQGSSLDGIGTGIVANDMNLTIELIGNNTITVENLENATNYGILVSGGSLIVKSVSDGKLTVNAGDATDSVYGIYSVGPISVSGANLDVTTGDADTSIGIKTESHYVYDADALGLITMNRGHLAFTDDAKVKITTGKGTILSRGIDSYGDFVVDKAELDIIGGIGVSGYAKFISGKVTACIEMGGTAISCAVAEEKDETTGEVTRYGGYIDIYDGIEIVAKTGDDELGGVGINATNDIKIHGGKITITMGNVTGDKVRRSYGIFSFQGSINIYGGTTSISVPECVKQYDDFMPVCVWHGRVSISDNITVTGTTAPFMNGGGGCGQADPKIPVVFTDNFKIDKLLGDADKDGQLNIKDATAIQKNIAGLLKFDSEQTALADFNEDNEVNIKDATAIQKKIAGLI